MEMTEEEYRKKAMEAIQYCEENNIMPELRWTPEMQAESDKIAESIRWAKEELAKECGIPSELDRQLFTDTAVYGRSVIHVADSGVITRLHPLTDINKDNGTDNQEENTGADI